MSVLRSSPQSSVMATKSVGDVSMAETQTPRKLSLDIRVLDAELLEDRAAWLELWDEWPDREIMAHPDYARLFARPQDRVLAVTARGAAGGVLYPIILRPLAQEPWGVEAFDTTTPYGYGGPFSWGMTPSEVEAFWKAFDEWARRQKVVTSFARLSLFPGKLLPWQGKVERSGPNVIRRLDLPESELWTDYTYKVRQNVQRARRQGLKVEADLHGARLDEFLSVYLATMRRCGASPSYYFPKSFFEAICTDLQGYYAFFHMTLGTKVIASELVLLSQDYAYSFLGGSFEEAFELRGNEFLKHESFLWCRSTGKCGIILGGGYRGEDGILQFKRGFAPGGEVSFNLGVAVYDPSLCNQLAERRQIYEQEHSVDWKPRPGYFPPYRA
jgi:hypothetical protein